MTVHRELVVSGVAALANYCVGSGGAAFAMSSIGRAFTMAATMVLVGADNGYVGGCSIGRGGWWYPPLVVGGWGVLMAVSLAAIIFDG